MPFFVPLSIACGRIINAFESESDSKLLYLNFLPMTTGHQTGLDSSKKQISRKVQLSKVPYKMLLVWVESSEINSNKKLEKIDTPLWPSKLFQENHLARYSPWYLPEHLEANLHGKVSFEFWKDFLWLKSVNGPFSDYEHTVGAVNELLFMSNSGA